MPVGYTKGMGFIKGVKAIPETVSETGNKINDGIDTATIYLVIIGTVAIAALIVSAIALGKSRA
jgi:hypothetical protein